MVVQVINPKEREQNVWSQAISYCIAFYSYLSRIPFFFFIKKAYIAVIGNTMERVSIFFVLWIWSLTWFSYHSITLEEVFGLIFPNLWFYANNHNFLFDHWIELKFYQNILESFFIYGYNFISIKHLKCIVIMSINYYAGIVLVS